MARVLVIVGGGAALAKAAARSLNLQWDESKFRRGQPGNAGQFAPKGGGGASGADTGGGADNSGSGGSGALAARLGRTEGYQGPERQPTRLKFGVEDLVFTEAEKKQSPWTWRVKRIADTIGNIFEPMAMWALDDSMVEAVRREVIENDDQVGQMMVDVHRNMRAGMSARERQEARATVIAMYKDAVAKKQQEGDGGAGGVRKGIPVARPAARTLYEACLPPVGLAACLAGAQEPEAVSVAGKVRRRVVAAFGWLTKAASQLSLFDESNVARHPKGSDKGGQFAPKPKKKSDESEIIGGLPVSLWQKVYGDDWRRHAEKKQRTEQLRESRTATIPPGDMEAAAYLKERGIEVLTGSFHTKRKLRDPRPGEVTAAAEALKEIEAVVDMRISDPLYIGFWGKKSVTGSNTRAELSRYEPPNGRAEYCMTLAQTFTDSIGHEFAHYLDRTLDLSIDAFDLSDDDRRALYRHWGEHGATIKHSMYLVKRREMFAHVFSLWLAEKSGLEDDGWYLPDEMRDSMFAQLEAALKRADLKKALLAVVRRRTEEARA